MRALERERGGARVPGRGGPVRPPASPQLRAGVSAAQIQWTVQPVASLESDLRHGQQRAGIATPVSNQAPLERAARAPAVRARGSVCAQGPYCPDFTAVCFSRDSAPAAIAVEAGCALEIAVSLC